MRIGVLSIQGLPASYGAFEQTVDRLVRYCEKSGAPIEFIVGCSSLLRPRHYDSSIVTRVFSYRFTGIGVILYGLTSFIKIYLRGVRVFLIMGYGLGPFIPAMRALGCKIVINVDGFEWRRAKWGKIAKQYFKLCERLVASSSVTIICDSRVIQRYFKYKYKRSGKLIFYGADDDQVWQSGAINSIATGKQDSFSVCVMRMEPENNIGTIVEGYLKSQTEVKLFLVGPSTQYFEKNIIPLLNGSGKGRVEWLGPIYDRTSLYSIRRKASFYIHGHSVGGTNPTLVEACFIGKPIIAFRSSFNREVLGEHARYFTDSAELARILDNMSWQDVTPPILGPDYTWTVVGSRYLEALKQCGSDK